jgi:putative DNA primase/helicase
MVTDADGRRIVALSHPEICNRLTRHVGFVKRGKKGSWGEITVPSRVAAEVGSRGEWPGVRVLRGITEAPTLRPDGSVCQDPGYDSATGFLYAPNAVYPRIPEEPTQDDARAALVSLLDPFVDFAFASTVHGAVPIAALLTILARPAILGAVPGFALDAATRGTGKSLLADAIAMIALGRSADRATFPEDDTELEKLLSSFALSGSRVVLLDNVTRRFGGGPLDKLLTASDRVAMRVLGRSEIASVVWSAVVLCSGNNLTFGEDTLRRVLLCRQESELESPELRSGFRYDPLLDHLAAVRPQLVAAALTILRAWRCKDLTSAAGPWGSFSAWAKLVPPAIMFAGGPNVIEARPSQDLAEDETIGALRTVLECLPRLSSEPIAASRLCDLLYPGPKEHEPPDGHEALREALDSLGAIPRGKLHPTPKSLSRCLGKVLGRVLGGLRLRASTHEGRSRLYCVQTVR